MTSFTYTSLKSAIAGFLMRDDLEAAIPTFVMLAEAGISRNLRHWRQETRIDVDFDSGYVDLPSDWLETVRLSIDGYGPLELLGPQDMMQKKGDAQRTGSPKFFTHQGGKIELWPLDADASGELVYFAKAASLSDSVESNWILESAPDVYLYGSLIHSAPYIREDERLVSWGALYESALAALQAESDRARFSGPLKMGAPR